MVKIKIITNTKFAGSYKYDYIDLTDEEFEQLKKSEGSGYEICKNEAFEIQGFEWCWEEIK